MKSSVPKIMAMGIIETAPDVLPYQQSIIVDGKRIQEKLTLRWIQHFMSRSKTVPRIQCGKIRLSNAKILLIEKEVAFDLGKLKRGFERGELNENLIEHADETHFILYMDNSRTLGLRGDENVRYAAFVSGSDLIMMMVRLSGVNHLCVQPFMLIFKKNNRSHRIRGIADDVPRGCYRSTPKGWTNGLIWHEWLSEPRLLPKLGQGKKRTLFVDNFSLHAADDDSDSELLEKSYTDLQKLVANVNELSQAADSFVIQKMKDLWRRL